ncbi:MAG: GNAT family N-acetyltransferase [Bacteroidales bacterium]|nr:GNAT family N-acetyltransferase [Bacteroidales bacterium]
MSSKEKYRQLCNEDKSIPVFLTYNWLDCVNAGNWDVLLYEKDGIITGAMPYRVHKKYGMKTIMPPVFTPYCGIYVNYRNCTTPHRRYTLENSVCSYFAQKLASMHLQACFYPLQPQNMFSSEFFRQGFSCNVRYTYAANISDMEKCYGGFTSMMKTHIKKAQKTLSVKEYDGSLKEIYNILCQTYANQKVSVPFSLKDLENITAFARTYNQGRWFAAVDDEENIHAVLFLLWDNDTAYSLINATNYRFASSNAGALIVFKAMQYAHSQQLKRFDFEGSMLKGVENFYIHFNSLRTPYIYMVKYYGRLYKCLRTLKQKTV